MKTITQDDGTQIQSPWLKTGEAAKYVGMSRDLFRQKNQVMPCPYAGAAPTDDERNRKYHSAVLDQWLIKLGGIDHAPIPPNSNTVA